MKGNQPTNQKGLKGNLKKKKEKRKSNAKALICVDDISSLKPFFDWIAYGHFRLQWLCLWGFERSLVWAARALHKTKENTNKKKKESLCCVSKGWRWTVKSFFVGFAKMCSKQNNFEPRVCLFILSCWELKNFFPIGYLITYILYLKFLLLDVMVGKLECFFLLMERLFE